MEEWVIILLGAAGGVVLIAVIATVAYCVAASRRTEEYQPLEKGNVFVYERDNSQQIKEDTIMMNARFYLRSTIYTLDKQLPQFGSRPDKNYFSVVGTAQPNSKNEGERVMSMVPVSKNWPIPLSTEQGRQTFRTIIKSMEIHPFICVPLLVDFLPDKMMAVTVRPFYAKGSLRDYIHQSKPKNRYHDKYVQQFQLNDKLISKFGRQILEALLFLKYHNMPYYHLNASNIMLDDTNCLVSDYENAFLGLKPRFSKYLLAHSEKLDPEVLTFGCILYEMGCGFEMESPQSVEQIGIPNHCHPEVKKILESIFKPWYGNPPTLEELTKLSFFADWKFKNLPIQRVTFTTREKDMIDAVNKLNKAHITQQKAENVPSMKTLKKQKKRKTLTFVPIEVSLNPTSSGNTSVPTFSSSMSASNLTNTFNSSMSSSFSTTSLSSQQSFGNLSNSYQPTSNTSSSNLATATTQKSASYQPTSSTTAPSSAPPPPPPAPPAPKSAPPPPPSAPAPPPPPPSSGGGGGDRRGLLSSIEGFRSGSLKKTKTKDRSAPKV
ncbi:Slob family protein kinase [Heterostelium album PN500]|uniref:Slob family protein kinase n=1 Tax=Heterostelium pallidum (strain ATCC 26659 / Pp 5 / PN500) TaxID=670386 RepID=D3B212_HETP5|nr:Slob family protein kinase [Heterostelium album PN500]EFA85336.1 Slob family protein kinase [Heterostelium album PN500]|eukprot:XP_020437445.1 Slob family protein kinase [Heterostelium album PN500]